MGNASRAIIRMRLFRFAAAFLAVWIAFACFFVIATLNDGARHESRSFAVPLGFLSFGYLLASISFGIEARRARRSLERLLAYSPDHSGVSRELTA
jgi:ABC-type multidrug transport system permease subunit